MLRTFTLLWVNKCKRIVNAYTQSIRIANADGQGLSLKDSVRLAVKNIEVNFMFLASFVRIFAVPAKIGCGSEEKIKRACFFFSRLSLLCRSGEDRLHSL